MQASLKLFYTALIGALLLVMSAPAYAGLYDLETKLTAPDGDMFDYFGITVAISGNRAVVGKPEPLSRGGTAYVYDVTTGGQVSTLNYPVSLPPIDDNEFGVSVGISGNTVIVGGPSGYDAGIDTGVAYLFDADTGNQLFKLTASDGAAGDNFGRHVGISGNRAIVAGGAATYVFDVSSGSELLKIPDYGRLAISGNTAIIGTTLFDVATGNELFELTATDGSEGDGFGDSVAIDGNTAIIGAYQDDDNGYKSGSAYLFDVSTGNQLFKLTPTDGEAWDRFGDSVAISGNRALVGAPLESDLALIRIPGSLTCST